MLSPCRLLLLSTILWVAWGQQGDPAIDYSGTWALIKQLGGMQPAQQAMMLTLVGVQLKNQFGMDCNIFAGKTSCKSLPATSSYRQQCPNSAALVDCAFFDGIANETVRSPTQAVEAGLGIQSVAKLCPECTSALQAMFCALAVPSCGTFQSYTNNVLLPLLTDAAILAQTAPEGTKPVNPYPEAVWSRALPCREMCTAIIDTCGCGGSDEEPPTVGEIVKWMQENNPEAHVSKEVVEFLLEAVWDRPFCDIFPPLTKNFTGKCDITGLSRMCKKRDEWCGSASGNGGSGALKAAQALLAQQIVQGVTGWLHDLNKPHGGNNDKLDPAGGGSHIGFDDRPKPSLSGGQVAGITIMVVCVGSMLMAAAWHYGRQLWRRRKEGTYFELQRTENFEPLQHASA